MSTLGEAHGTDAIGSTGTVGAPVPGMNGAMQVFFCNNGVNRLLSRMCPIAAIPQGNGNEATT